VAAKRFRERGLDGIGVADVMKEAGVTVGGFYKHFGSRDELVVEALQCRSTHACNRWPGVDADINWMRQVRVRGRLRKPEPIQSRVQAILWPARYQGPARRQSRGDHYRLTLNSWVAMGSLFSTVANRP
jgi:AcrR family transcriptional regulator